MIKSKSIYKVDFINKIVWVLKNIHLNIQLTKCFVSFSEASNDVTKAIELCTENHKKTLNQAHCQRGILYRRVNKIDEARKDFEISAKMGNHFAKSQVKKFFFHFESVN